MKFFNRLAHREYLVLVALAASALTLHVRQQVIDAQAQSAQAPRADDGRICEPPAARPGKARVLPADCGVRSDARPNRTHAFWV
ncbi:hypothetical protein [Caballeronia sp. J97]|uniref:hypothetical protein n=1 Tax=Caballeronia sp. J97 TaxID=2805429 RepID=UPI002AAF8282|nr:hypothetical protein [Caballeronia sp. J97]